MTRLDRVLKLLEEYDSLVAVAFTHYCVGQDCRKMLTYLRAEKDQLKQELIKHGYRRGIDIISQDIFSEKPTMQDETWCG